MTPQSYFVVGPSGRFLPTDYARGPWNIDACHAGPPTALLARASERLVPTKPLVRLSVEITRPIPMTGFSVSSEIVRDGRTVVQTRLQIHDADRSYGFGDGLHLATVDLGDVGTHTTDPPIFDTAVPGEFPFPNPHEPGGFSDSLEVRYDPRFSRGDGGETMIWARSKVPMLPDEQPSPFQRLCPMADSGNGISWHERPGRISFLNADLVVSVHRPPDGEWIGSHTVSYWEPTGVGRTDAELFDRRGPVGRAMQHLVIRIES